MPLLGLELKDARLQVCGVPRCRRRGLGLMCSGSRDFEIPGPLEWELGFSAYELAV